MQSYLQKNSLYERLIKQEPSQNLELCVICPAYKESGLFDALDSLLACQPLTGIVEIFPILNYPESEYSNQSTFHINQYKELLHLENATSQQAIKVKAIQPFGLPVKFAGVGLARKIGMDEAVRRFEYLNSDGIILNYDADCRCDPGYFREVIRFFTDNNEAEAVSIGFKHRMDDIPEELQRAIILYELHLRTYIGWQRYFKYPFAFQTLGSSFAVRSKAYQLQGGMNKRKAGEDFYFLHKYSVLGKLASLDRKLVFPSGRVSRRVPFGTGKAVGEIIESNGPYYSYNPKAIKCFCNFFSRLNNEYELVKKCRAFQKLTDCGSLLSFLEKINFSIEVESCLKHSSSELAFQKRISRKLDPFLLMKYLHFARSFEFPDVDVMDSAGQLLETVFPEYKSKTHPAIELLEKILEY